MAETKQGQKPAEKATAKTSAPKTGNVPEQAKKTPQKENMATSIKMDEGQLQTTNLAEEWKLAELMVQSGMLPSRYDTPAKVITAKQFAKELGLQPLTGLKQIAVIDGNPTIYGDLPLAIVRRTGELEKIDEYYHDAEGKRISVENSNLMADPAVAICVIKRKGQEEVMRFWNDEQTKKAGLKDRKVWLRYRSTMMKYRARSAALKDSFSDALNGISISEYDFNTIPTNDHDVPIATTAEIQADIDKNVTDEKIEIIHNIKQLHAELRSLDPTFNTARQTQLQAEYLHSDQMVWAKEENLSAYQDKLSLMIEGRKADA